MTQSIAAVTLLVRNYDEAIDFFTRSLRFVLLEDTSLGEGKRWVRVGGDGPSGMALLLARAATPEQQAQIGCQGGGRVWLFLHSTDFWGDYHHMRSQGVVFCEKPREEIYGTVVVFADLYGNQWDLIQRR